MPLWGSNNAQTAAPKYKVVESGVAAGPSKGTNTLFNNTSPGVFHKNQTLGVWGANATQVATSPGKIGHTGWHYCRQGTGPVANLTISAGGSAYVNLAIGTVTSGQTGGNATFQLTTNSTGGITAVTLLSGGAGFMNTAVTVVPGANGIVNVAIAAGGTGYANGETVNFSNGQVNASATLTTNSTGGITAVTFTSAGRGFPANTGTVVTITTAAGTTANLVVNVLGAGSGANVVVNTLGGRAGRLHYETLVAGGILGSPPNTLP